jgi:negative regulator of flagellin synthesis FlgM
MKIGPFDPKITPPPVGGDRKAGAPAKEAPAGPSATVDLSASAALKLDPNGEGSFDAAKVERIAQAIRDGQLKINAGAIADKLIANAQELLDRTGR